MKQAMEKGYGIRMKLKCFFDEWDMEGGGGGGHELDRSG